MHSIDWDSSSLTVVRMTILSFRARPAGWREIPCFYSLGMRFFKVKPFRMTLFSRAVAHLSFRMNMRNLLLLSSRTHVRDLIQNALFGRRFFDTSRLRMTSHRKDSTSYQETLHWRSVQNDMPSTSYTHREILLHYHSEPRLRASVRDLQPSLWEIFGVNSEQHHTAKIITLCERIFDAPPLGSPYLSWNKNLSE